MAKASDTLKIIEKMNRTDPELQEMVAESAINAEVALERQNLPNVHSQLSLTDLTNLTNSCYEQESVQEEFAMLFLKTLIQTFCLLKIVVS